MKIQSNNNIKCQFHRKLQYYSKVSYVNTTIIKIKDSNFKNFLRSVVSIFFNFLIFYNIIKAFQT